MIEVYIPAERRTDGREIVIQHYRGVSESEARRYIASLEGHSHYRGRIVSRPTAVPCIKEGE